MDPLPQAGGFWHLMCLIILTSGIENIQETGMTLVKFSHDISRA